MAQEGMLTGKSKYPKVIQDLLDKAKNKEEVQSILKMYEKMYKGGEFITDINVDF
jgi:hypothetical protein